MPCWHHDAAHGTELLRTLDTYLRHGLAKTPTAQVLGVRRQTLYSRLARREARLGGEPLAEYESHTALGVAGHDWRAAHRPRSGPAARLRDPGLTRPASGRRGRRVQHRLLEVEELGLLDREVLDLVHGACTSAGTALVSPSRAWASDVK